MPLVSDVPSIVQTSWTPRAQDFIDSQATSDIVPIFAARAKVNHAAIVFGRHQPNRRQSSDDTVLGAAQTFQVDAMVRGDLPRFGLVY